jgi:hypothetical protein
VSQFGGPGRPGGGGYGGDDGGDDREFPPFGEPGDETGRFGPGRQFDYQVEERYWTDYLRIALPVLGVIILLGLVWFWVASLLGDPNDEENNDVTPDVSGPVIVDESPTPDDQEGEDDQEPPLTVTTPTPEQPNNQDETPTGVIEPGATVVVANTDGAGLNMRAAPSTTAEIQEELEEGAALTITGESVEAEGYTWWPVESANSTGFVVENFIELSN